MIPLKLSSMYTTDLDNLLLKCLCGDRWYDPVAAQSRCPPKLAKTKWCDFILKAKFNIDEIRKEFKVLNLEDNKALVYFDNASTTLKPNSVINKLNEYYQK